MAVIKVHLGGFADDELRKILVRAGAVRFEAKSGSELWGLLERNHDLLGVTKVPWDPENPKENSLPQWVTSPKEGHGQPLPPSKTVFMIAAGAIPVAAIRDRDFIPTQAEPDNSTDRNCND
jgi:hypothetical protein